MSDREVEIQCGHAVKTNGPIVSTPPVSPPSVHDVHMYVDVHKTR